MGKRIPEHDKEADTKVLYKKSYNSIFTHSRTCSGTSQQTKSTTFQRRKLSNHKVFTDGQKLKKDLSIETDICVLRRYYKYKRNWMSSKAATSAKSRYSNYTEIDTIAEFRDSSACGDKLLGEDFDNLRPPTNMDRTNMMLDNFKDLLNKWITKHLIQGRGTEGKMEDVFEAVLQGVESRRAQKSSSCTTYILSKEDETDYRKCHVVNIAASTDYNGQCCSSRHPNITSYENFQQSRYTVPIICNNLRIISTLSIPRNINRRKRYNRRRKLRRIKVNRTPNKNLLVSYMKTPPKFLATVSSFNLLAISTKSLIKRCVNFDDNRFKNIDKNQQQHLVLFSEPSNKSATASAISIEEVKYKDLKKLKMHFNDKRLLMSKSLLENVSQRTNEKPARKEIDHCNNTETVIYCSKNENTDMFNTTDVFKNTAKVKNTNTSKTTDPFISTSPVKNTDPLKNASPLKNTSPHKNTSPLKSTRPHKNIEPTLRDNKYTIYKANAQISSILNERKYSEPLVSIDLLNQSLEYQREGKIHRFKCEENKNVKSNLNSNLQKSSLVCKKPKKKRHDRSSSVIRKYEKRKRHNFTYLYKRVNSKTFERDKLMRNMEDIIKYITNLNGGGNIKFEIHFNLGSGNVGKNEELLRMENSSKLAKKQSMEPKYSKPINDTQKPTMVYTANQTPHTNSKTFFAINKISMGCMCDQKTSVISSRTDLKKETSEIGCMCDKKTSVISTNTTLVKETPEIIPILDGAASQTKYMVSTHSIQKDTAVEKIQELQPENIIKNAKDKDYKTQQTSKKLIPFMDFDLKQEIGELRTAIRDLASTTEKLLKEHYQTKISIADATINSDTRIDSKKDSSLNIDTTLPSNSNSIELGTVESKKYSSINATVNNSIENSKSNSKRLSSGDATTNSLDDRIDSKEEEENEVRIVQYITNASLIKDQTIKATQYSTKIPPLNHHKTDNIQVVAANKHDKGLQNSSPKVTIEQSQEQKKRMASALKKHSASYRVIESESVIKVTNMTSNSSDSKQQLYYDKALTCSLPKSRSLFEFSMDFTNRDILAYFCDNIKTPLRSAFTYVTPAISPSSRSESRRGNVINIEEGQISKTSNEESDQQKSSGSTIFEETYSPDESKQVKFRTMGANEGVLLCTIIFVPVIIILVLLYEFVLKEKNSNPPKTDPDPTLYLKLSELGF